MNGETVSRADIIRSKPFLRRTYEERCLFDGAVRSLRPGGRMIMLEPWVTPFSRLIYGFAHHEPFAPAAGDWGFAAGDRLLAANGALPWIVFERDRSRFEAEFPKKGAV
jgi:hypothetical protein